MSPHLLRESFFNKAAHFHVDERNFTSDNFLKQKHLETLTAFCGYS